MQFIDSHGRIWPQVTIRKYQNNADFWYTYVEGLHALARKYEENEMPISAKATWDDTDDILKALAWK